jgi:hypothetical protein
MAEFEQIETVWTGASPLLMHNGRLADPLDEFSQKLKELNRPKDKTPAQYQEIERVEYEGGLYMDDELGICQPTDNLWACIIRGARKARLGKAAESSLIVEGIPGKGHASAVRLEYSGPKTAEGMFANKKFVSRVGIRIQKSRIMRVRPMIPAGWKLHFQVKFDPEVIKASDALKAMLDAGSLIGLGDWRPRYGRFTAEVAGLKV